VTATSDSDEIFEGLEHVPQYAPIRRLADNALAAVELQVRGRGDTALNNPQSLRRHLLLASALLSARDRHESVTDLDGTFDVVQSYRP